MASEKSAPKDEGLESIADAVAVDASGDALHPITPFDELVDAESDGRSAMTEEKARL